MWEGDAVDAPHKPDLEGSGKDLGHGASRVVDQSHTMMMNHGCDLTDGMQNDASCENPSAGMPIPAMLSDNQCDALCKEDDQCPKAHNLFFCETCIGLFV